MCPEKRRSNQCFKPSKRLRKRWQYRAMIGKSRALRFPDCTIYFIPNKEGHFRLGITVRARTNSVMRNYVKRTIREFFRTHAEAMGAFDFNVVIPPGRNLRHPFTRNLRKLLYEDFLTSWSKV